MENLPSSHDYGCPITQEIPCLSEDLKGDYNYKRLNIKE
jgi:hypothetical protein